MSKIILDDLDPKLEIFLREQAALSGCSLEKEICNRVSVSVPQRKNFFSDADQVFDQTLLHKEEQKKSLFSCRKHILLIVGGSIAAYKALDLIRRLRKFKIDVQVILTQSARVFISPLAVGALAGGQVFTDLFSRRMNEQDIGHIRLAHEADLVLFAPCSANRLAKMANGHASDLAGAVFLATRSPVIVAPAMNPAMWMHPATQRNVCFLKQNGVFFIGPEDGEMAEKHASGLGRMSEPQAIIKAIMSLFAKTKATGGILAGKHVIITSGPTQEPFDPIRYFSNHSSGKQGHVLASSLAAIGANVTLISGPVMLEDPLGIKTLHVETAQQMYEAVMDALPADAAIFVAAVADWRFAMPAEQKIKKEGKSMIFHMIKNRDILANIGKSKTQRPKLVIGFAAETWNILENAREKLFKKGADWIIANDVSKEESVMGGDNNQIVFVSKEGNEVWPRMSKVEVAENLAKRISEFLVQKY